MGNELGSSRADENKPGEALSLQPDDGGRSTGDRGNNDDHVVRSISPEGTHPSFRSLYRLGPKIGEGSHSQVFLAVERSTGRRVAAKAVHTDWLDRRRVEFLRAEIEIHQEVSIHPYIVRLLGFYDDPDACFIVEEVAEGGSLLGHLHARSTMGTEREDALLFLPSRNLCYPISSCRGHSSTRSSWPSSTSSSSPPRAGWGGKRTDTSSVEARR